MNFRSSFLVLGLVVRLIEGKTTITTASQTETMSARPTTLMKIIKVREVDYNTQKTTDIFQKNEKSARRNFRPNSALSKWDYFCMLQPETGNCGVNKTKFYYNAQLDQCMPHLFTGCSRKNNMNQHETLLDCENLCKGSALMPVTIPKEANICRLQPISGRCLGHVTMWYYDVNKRTCQTFAYGGCAGNENRFARELQCLYRCGNTAPDNKKSDVDDFDTQDK